MVTNFSSGAPAAPGTQSSGGNGLLIIGGLLLAGFLLYRFVIKPAQEEEK